MNNRELVGNGNISVKVIADSISSSGYRITTLQLRYPRFIHAEFLTHRIFSRNSSSSRAIPVSKMIEMVRNEPAIPIHWGKNQAGMQAKHELNEEEITKVKSLWIQAAEQASSLAEEMTKTGLHKQVANRVLEPFQFMNTIMTSTDFNNFFSLRDHPDAQPEIQELAKVMKSAIYASTPKKLSILEWHLPYVSDHEKETYSKKEQIVASVARCCRVSYLKHDNTVPLLYEDIDLYNKLVTANPPHMSPAEHQATPKMWLMPKSFCGNLNGWAQFRKLLEKDMEGLAFDV